MNLCKTRILALPARTTRYSQAYGVYLVFRSPGLSCPKLIYQNSLSILGIQCVCKSNPPSEIDASTMHIYLSCSFWKNSMTVVNCGVRLRR